MPSRPARYCPRCRAAHAGKCPRVKAWGNRRQGTTTERGYGHAWRKLRRQVLERDSYLCVPCLARGLYVEAREVDHITGKADGGTDDPGNLQSICTPCHRAKTARGGGAKV